MDRFHVAKRYRKGLDERRKKELKRLKKERPEADYQAFKGLMWLLRKNPAELKPEELEPKFLLIFIHYNTREWLLA